MAEKVLFPILEHALPEFAVEFGVEHRVVAAEQQFHRKLKQWEFAIERQKLFREDIRDLVELTVGRMDIYHLVGALLLEFCMVFYCENEMLKGKEEVDYPQWVVTIFMLSNLCAVGFLTLAVWLAMHASVASHSIGVRLLLRIIRPFVPDMDVINNLKVPVPAPWQSVDVSATNALEATTAASVDERNHFQEFLKRQKVFVCYDAYARTCMSLGMNAMLTALSYYIIGCQSQDHAISAFVSVGGVQTLSVLLLVLDVKKSQKDIRDIRGRTSSEDINTYHAWRRWWSRSFGSAFENIREVLCVLVLQFLPPLWSLILVHNWPTQETKSKWSIGTRWINALATLSFFSRALWYFFVYQVGKPETSGDLPRRLRFVEFMDVMSADDMEIGATEACRDLIDAREKLLARMVEVPEDMSRRDITEVVRTLEEVALKKARDCQRLLDAACPYPSSSQSSLAPPPTFGSFSRRNVLPPTSQCTLASTAETLNDEIRRSEQLIKVIKRVDGLWKSAPDVLANLEALRTFKEEAKKMQQELSGQEFEQQINHMQQELRNRYGQLRDKLRPRKGSAAGEDQIPFAMEEGDLQPNRPLPMVRFAVAAGDGSQYEYADPERFQRLRVPKEPADRRSINYQSAIQQHKAWMESANCVLEVERAGVQVVRDGIVYGSGADSDGDVGEPGRGARGTLPEMLDTLPKTVVRVFNRSCIFLWCVAAVAHFFDGLIEHRTSAFTLSEPPFLEQIALAPHRSYNITWPAPAALFEVGELHCANNSVLVSSRFSLYVMRQEAKATSLSVADEVHGLPAAEVLCDDSGCVAIVKGKKGSESWDLVPVTGALEPTRPSEFASIPTTWNRLAAMWQPCVHAYAPCESLIIAGWSGSEILVGEARRVLPAGTWDVQMRFAVRPDMASCDTMLESEGRCLSVDGPKTYEDVRALQLGQGRTLAVLLGGGFMDGWDLTSGAFLGRWQVGRGDYTSMCHGEREIVLVQRGGRFGPQLEVVELPAAFSSAAFQPAGLTYG